MVSEMIKKWSRAGFYLSCNYSCTLYFLLKILLAKLKEPFYFNILESKSWCSNNKPKMWGEQRWWDLLKLETNTFTSLYLVIFSTIIATLFLLVGNRFWKTAAWGKWVISFCLGGDNKNLWESLAKGHE